MAKKKKPLHLPIQLPKLVFTDKKQGFVAVLVGIITALFLGLLATGFGWTATWVYILLVLGVIVGVLNIFHEEAILFLISGLTITFMLNLLAGLTLAAWIVTPLNAIVYLLAPASAVVGLKVLYTLATKQ